VHACVAGDLGCADLVAGAARVSAAGMASHADELACAYYVAEAEVWIADAGGAP